VRIVLSWTLKIIMSFWKQDTKLKVVFYILVVIFCLVFNN
jgi:hypothetical protein